MQLNNQDLWLKCAEWGSYIAVGDPGACMYRFNETSSFYDRNHAEQVINYVNDNCRHVATNNDDKQDLTDIVDTAKAFLH